MAKHTLSLCTAHLATVCRALLMYITQEREPRDKNDAEYLLDILGPRLFQVGVCTGCYTLEAECKLSGPNRKCCPDCKHETVKS